MHQHPQAAVQEIYGEIEPGASLSMPNLELLGQGCQAAKESASKAFYKPSTAHAAPGIVRFSLQPLSALKQMTIKELKGGVVHLGRYILLRVVSDPVLLKGLSIIVQDKEGTHCCLTIHNLMPEGPAEPGAAAAAVPQGSVLAIKVSCWATSYHHAAAWMHLPNINAGQQVSCALYVAGYPGSPQEPYVTVLDPEFQSWSPYIR
jgi:hypothetical protein